MMKTDAPVSISTVRPHGETADFAAARERFMAQRDALIVEYIYLVAPIAARIRAKLPASFELDDLIACGNLALIKAATRYRPREHGGAPFSAYARAAIEGAMRDSFRANKFAENTRPPLPDNVIEFPGPGRRPAVEDRIELGQRFAELRRHVTACLPPRQVAVIDAYYSPQLPDLATVAGQLGITPLQAEKAHAAAIRTLRARLTVAA